MTPILLWTILALAVPLVGSFSFRLSPNANRHWQQLAFRAKMPPIPHRAQQLPPPYHHIYHLGNEMVQQLAFRRNMPRGFPQSPPVVENASTPSTNEKEGGALKKLQETIRVLRKDATASTAVVRDSATQKESTVPKEGVVTGDTSSGESGTSSLDSSTFSFAQALRERQAQLQKGIGKRYKVAGPAIKVHSSMLEGPFCTENLVGFLQEGDVVTSIDKIGDYWIKHDGGGDPEKAGWSYIYRNTGLVVQEIDE